jgi:AcrR family transcriptional regulator
MVSLPEYLTQGPVGREEVSRDVIDSEHRDHILDVATEVFAKRGYPATTVDHIVSAARIGVGRFYSLFDGKEDCFLQAYERNLATGRARVAESIPEEADWPELACATLQSVLGMIAAEPLAARLLLAEAQTAGGAALRRYEETIDQLVPVLRAGREVSPMADELPQTLEVAVLGGLLWFLQQRVVLGELDGLEDRLPEVADIVLAPYLGKKETKRVLKSVSRVAAA